MRVFVLEDDPQRIRLFREAAIGLDATFAESVGEAVEKFAPPYDALLLDHDLGGEVFVPSDVQNTGAGFCRWLETASDHFRPNVIVHSYNRDGALNMIATLHDKGHRAIASPFGPSVLGWLRSCSERASAQAADAVDPQVTDTGKPSTRA